MRTARFVTAVLLCACAAGGSAGAADHPNFPPARDVAVTYRVTGGSASDGPITVHLAYSAAMRKLRGNKGDEGAMLVDFNAKSVVIMITAQHIAMRLPVGQEIDRALALGQNGNGNATNNGTTMVRAGTDTVAGNACTVWKFTGKDGSGTGCITEDGVPLRGQGADGKGKGGSFEATEVSYGRQSAALFEVPAGFKTIELPAGMGAQRPKP